VNIFQFEVLRKVISYFLGNSDAPISLFDENGIPLSSIKSAKTIMILCTFRRSTFLTAFVLLVFFRPVGLHAEEIKSFAVGHAGSGGLKPDFEYFDHRIVSVMNDPILSGYYLIFSYDTLSSPNGYPLGKETYSQVFRIETTGFIAIDDPSVASLILKKSKELIVFQGSPLSETDQSRPQEAGADKECDLLSERTMLPASDSSNTTPWYLLRFSSVPLVTGRMSALGCDNLFGQSYTLSFAESLSPHVVLFGNNDQILIDRSYPFALRSKIGKPSCFSLRIDAPMLRKKILYSLNFKPLPEVLMPSNKKAVDNLKFQVELASNFEAVWSQLTALQQCTDVVQDEMDDPTAAIVKDAGRAYLDFDRPQQE
jgi:hypothetical protein